MHIITAAASRRLRDVWREAGALEIPGCLIFAMDNDGRYVSDGETRQDVPRNSRRSVPYPCDESNTNIDFHTHPRDSRNIAHGDLVYLSPPSANDLATRIVLAATGENMTAALVLSEEGIYVIRNTTQWSKRVTRRIIELKEANAGLIDYVVYLMRQYAMLATLLNVSVNARAEAIARLPLRAARDAVVIETLPAADALIHTLRRTMETSETKKEYREHAARFGIDVTLHPYDKEMRFAMAKHVHRSRWPQNPVMEDTMEQMINLDADVFREALVLQAHRVSGDLASILPKGARPNFTFQHDVALRRRLLENPKNKALVYRGGSDMSLRLIGADTAPATSQNAFVLIDDTRAQSQDVFEMRFGIHYVYSYDSPDGIGYSQQLSKAEMANKAPFPPLSLTFLMYGGDGKKKSKNSVAYSQIEGVDVRYRRIYILGRELPTPPRTVPLY